MGIWDCRVVGLWGHGVRSYVEVLPKGHLQMGFFCIVLFGVCFNVPQCIKAHPRLNSVRRYPKSQKPMTIRGGSLGPILHDIVRIVCNASISFGLSISCYGYLLIDRSSSCPPAPARGCQGWQPLDLMGLGPCCMCSLWLIRSIRAKGLYRVAGW